MESIKTDRSFQFCTQSSLVELTGLRARNLLELLNHLETVPGSVIYYHTHHFLKQHHSLSPEPPNDFAYWITHVLNEDRLGERLAAVDTIRFSSLKALRDQLMSVIRQHISSGAPVRQAAAGEEFHFMQSRSFILKTPYTASSLSEFADGIRKISIYALYHHIFESRLRLERGQNDFSIWLAQELQEQKLADAIGRLDPYTQTLEGLRTRILKLIDRRIHESNRN